ncbi:MAG: ClpXP protease specificity-enhancing factor [Gammaproteobacteria bacterium]|nr:ClpXP protease specificity-enhancing factor [Gammaproteobacteria bacterium]
MAISKQPYFMRALYDWMVDSGLTPHLLIDAASEAVVVPREYVADGRIVLNVSPTAVRGFTIANVSLSFDGRFAGRAFRVSAPTSSVMAIYAKETGEGMMFNEDAPAPDEAPKASRSPALKLVT